MRFPIMCAALVASLFASTGAHANSFSGFRLEVRTGYDNNSADGVSAGGILARVIHEPAALVCPELNQS